VFSAVTIRADLVELGAKGLLVRSHGGAVLPLSPKQEYPLQLKKTLHHAEKVRIGRAVAQLVQPRQTVIIDGGTTTAELARTLKRNSPEALTVITHALNVALELADFSKHIAHVDRRGFPSYIEIVRRPAGRAHDEPSTCRSLFPRRRGSGSDWNYTIAPM